MADGAVREIAFLAPGTAPLAAASPAACEAVRQLTAWLRDPRFAFSLALDPAGTPFQRRIWEAIARIPVGETRTYGELARRVGATPRAVGQACGANPLPVVVPCHRVVAATGIGGFAHATGGFLLDAKRWLLAHERLAQSPQRALFADAAG